MKTERLGNGLLIMDEEPFKGILIHEGSQRFREYENDNPEPLSMEDM